MGVELEQKTEKLTFSEFLLYPVLIGAEIKCKTAWMV